MKRQINDQLQRFMLLLMAIAISTLAACATQSTAFNDRSAEASVTLTWATNEATKLAAAGAITKQQFSGVLDASRAGSLALDTAKTLNAQGDATGAAAQLSMATTILSSVKTFLISYGAKP